MQRATGALRRRSLGRRRLATCQRPAATRRQAEGLRLHRGQGAARSPAEAIREQTDVQGDFQYAGIDDHYFMAAALAPGRRKVTFQPLTISAAGRPKDPPRDLIAYALEPSADETPISSTSARRISMSSPLSIATSCGRSTSACSRSSSCRCCASLNWINGFVGNYGWSIIILTSSSTLLMFPLRHKSVVSMRKMQEIQPEAKAIQDRYAKLKATDPAKQKMNQELMALYRERGVNPASGCVPMLLTFPVLLAFYALLSTAIELRGAPFIGWIHDLSRPIPTT